MHRKCSFGESVLLCIALSQIFICRARTRTAATSKVELFVIIVNGFQPLTIITKSSTLDVAAVLDPPLTCHEIFTHSLVIRASPFSWLGPSIKRNFEAFWRIRSKNRSVDCPFLMFSKVF